MIKDIKNMHQTNRTTIEGLIISLLCFAILIFAFQDILSFASSELRLAFAFDTDEFNQATMVKNVLINGGLIQHHAYGHLYFNVALLLLNLFGISAESSIILILRGISLAGVSLCVGVLYLISREFFSKAYSVLISLFGIISSLSFLKYGVIIHPDTLQVFFLSIGYLFLIRSIKYASHRNVRFASIAAGFAFSTKYSGIFLLPSILLALFWFKETLPKESSLTIHLVRLFFIVSGVLGLVAGIFMTLDQIGVFFNHSESFSSLEHAMFSKMKILITICSAVSLLIGTTPFLSNFIMIKKLSGFVQEGIICFVIFFISFALTSPGLLFGMRFIKGIIAESIHVGFGHTFAATNSQLDWFSILFSSEGFGLFGGIGVLIGLCMLPRELFKKRDLAPMLLVGFVFFLFLLIRVKYHEARYLFPLWPISALGLGICLSLVFKKSAALRNALLLIIVVVSAVPVFDWFRIEQRRVTTNAVSFRVAAGHELSKRYSADSVIAYDPYIYIPSKFKNASWDWEWTEEKLSKLNPNVIVVDSARKSLFSDLNKALDYIGGEDKFTKIHNFYRKLFDGSLNYKTTYQIDEIIFFERE